MIQVLAFCMLIGIAWYVLISRPQRAQQQQHDAMLSTLKVGDYVMTVAGVFGVVQEISPGSVVLEVAPGVTTHIATDGIARIVPGQAPTPTPVQQPAVQTIQQQIAGQQLAPPQQPVAYPAQQPAAALTPGPVLQPQFEFRAAPAQARQPDPAHFSTAASTHVNAPAPAVSQPANQSPVPRTHSGSGRVSAAPDGLLQAQTIDPQLAEQARQERSALAAGYQQTSASLVASTADTPAAPAAIPRPAAAPAPATVPLFVSQRRGAAAQGRPAPDVPRFPAPARPTEVRVVGESTWRPPLLEGWQPSHTPIASSFKVDVPYAVPRVTSLWDAPGDGAQSA